MSSPLATPKRDPSGRELWRYSVDDLHSADEGMRKCLRLAQVAAKTELPILVIGESGTGKTMLARAIHNSSARAAAPFVAFNAAALSDTLLDSQLFGHERGAFTGATRRVKGKFELADTGTLFIDEVADMTPAAQAKILRAVEYGEFERLGSETLQTSDVRLISATHLPLHRFVELDHFRKDLFYRISGFTIAVPALRERPEDLRALVAIEIASASAALGKRIVGLSKPAAEMLFAYHWPGNLRELKRVIHSAAAMTDGDIVMPEAVLIDQRPASPAASSVSDSVTGVATDAARFASTGGTMSGTSTSGAAHAPLDETLRAVELRHIHAVLERLGGNKRKAAKVLGLSRSTLDRKLALPGHATARDGWSPDATHA